MTHQFRSIKEVVDYHLQGLTRDAALQIPIKRESIVHPREPSPTYSGNDSDDSIIMVDSLRRSPAKNEGGSNQTNTRPEKRQICWVEIPPRPKRKRVSSELVKSEPLSPDSTIQVIAAAPAVKEEPDQEMANTLAVIRNVS